MEIRAIIVQPDGTYEISQIRRDLQTLQTLVGGYIEAVYGFWDDTGQPTTTFFHNEEGKLRGMDVNNAATALWYRADHSMIGRDMLVGPVVVTGFADSEGETLAVPDDVVTMWEGMNR